MALGDGVVWNEALPDNDTVAHEIDDYTRHLMVGVRSRMAREHIWLSSQTSTNEGGHHNFITFQAQTNAPIMAGTTAGALYVGDSASGYPLMFENSAGNSITIVSSHGSLACVSGGTQGSIPICSSANPTSLTLLSASAPGLPLITQSNGGTPIWTTVTASGVSSVLGVWDTTKSASTVYQATADSIVIAMHRKPTFGVEVFECVGYTDTNNPPTTVAARQREYDGSAQPSEHTIVFPVRKGAYWKVTFSHTAVGITVIPIGV